jgi:hypothetical protein
MKRNLSIRYFVITFKAVTCLALFLSGVALGQELQRTDSREKIKLKGRVVADVAELAQVWHPRFDSFIFVAAQKNGGKNTDSVAVRIIYEHFSEADSLPNEFFDYSKLYKLKVFRKKACDAKLRDFAYAKTNLEADMSLLRLLEGANADLLDENKILPCYVLKAKGYVVKNETK